jgi:alkyl sulfatase BDS1-like metallo-beta-lactamase superfamily hydrolase
LISAFVAGRHRIDPLALHGFRRNVSDELSNGVLTHHPTTRKQPADLVVTLTRSQLLGMLAGAGAEGVQFDGDPQTFATIAGFTDEPDPSFAIVTP